MFERIDKTLAERKDFQMDVVEREETEDFAVIKNLLEKLEEKDLIRSDLANLGIRVDAFRSGGPGGQNVNKVETGIRLVLDSLGIEVKATSERSQARNLQAAIENLKEKLKNRLRFLEESAKERVPTKPPKGAKEERLREKKAQSEKKQMRLPPHYEHE